MGWTLDGNLSPSGSGGAEIYAYDGTDYQGPLLRAFFGPVDPEDDGFTGTDGDGWIDFGNLIGILDEDYNAATWNSDTTHTASRNALRDKFVATDAYLSFVRILRATLTDKTSFASTASEQWGSETASLDDALLPKLTGVTVEAQVFGIALNDVGGTALSVRVEISLDGGATWDATGRSTQVIMGAGTNASNKYSISAASLVTGTVTGDVLARVVANCSSGASTAWDLINGHIIMTVEVHP